MPPKFILDKKANTSQAKASPKDKSDPQNVPIKFAEVKTKKDKAEINGTLTLSKSKQRARERERGKKFHVNMLNISHLQKYRKYNKLPTVKVRSSREELVKAAGIHFNSMVVNEAKMIAEFLFHVAKKKSKIYSALTD
ncbi:hypothetical protein K502DRAFT_341842 [Neoconidiobolus thromboides FSU 785]|nr:hypothetical protein K502DRAFT_341842 [Neoconidiobolus thromboides FSU 785]